MKHSKFLVLVVLSSLWLIGIIAAAEPCDRDFRINGRHWKYYKMDDGNQYHQLKLDRLVGDGDIIALDIPCPGYVADSLQIEWDDMRSDMTAELFSFPGTKSHGVKHIGSPKTRDIWAINQAIDRLEIRFYGRKQAKIFWVRLFYGQKLIATDAPRIGDTATFLHEIHLANGRVRRGNVLSYRDGAFVIDFDAKGQPERMNLAVGEVNKIVFPEDQPWGEADSKEGFTFPFKGILYHNKLIDYTKKEAFGLITKTDRPIDSFVVITFIKGDPSVGKIKQSVPDSPEPRHHSQPKRPR